jgi:hypothetical protein
VCQSHTVPKIHKSSCTSGSTRDCIEMFVLPIFITLHVQFVSKEGRRGIISGKRHDKCESCRTLLGRNLSINLFIFILQTMVLVLNGVLQDECIPLDTHSLFMQHPIYRDTANSLLQIAPKTVSSYWQLIGNFHNH